MLDANGKPFTAQPPQPRIDGTLGTPRERTLIDWQVTNTLATQFNEDPESMKIDIDGQLIGYAGEGG